MDGLVNEKLLIKSRKTKKEYDKWLRFMCVLIYVRVRETASVDSVASSNKREQLKVLSVLPMSL